MAFRHFFACLFLLILSVQWIGGVLYVKLSHSALIQSKMTEGEAALAEQVETEYGIQTKIKILDEQERNAMINAGYGAPFIFSTSDSDHPEYFTVEMDCAEWVTTEQLVNGPKHNDDANLALVSLNKLFSPFIINKTQVLKPAETKAFLSENFDYQPLADLFHPHIPTPPPALAA